MPESNHYKPGIGVSLQDMAYFSLLLYYLFGIVEKVSAGKIITVILMCGFYLAYRVWSSKKKKKKVNTRKIFTVTRHDFRRACFKGGLAAGFTGPLIILIIFSIHNPFWLGYENVDTQQFVGKISLLLFLLQIIVGGFLGWICGRFSTMKYGFPQSPIKKIFHLVVFIVAFVSIFLFRQLMARDARISPNTYSEIATDTNFLKAHCKAADFIYTPVKDSAQVVKYYVRKGGGYFGEPDFESLATGIMGGLAFLVLVFELSKLFSQAAFRTISLSGKKTFLIAAKAAFLGFIGWLFVWSVYTVLTDNCIIKKYDYIYGRYFFMFDFPHPARFLLNFMFCAMYIFCFLLLIRLHATPKIAVTGRRKITKLRMDKETKGAGSISK